MKKKICILIGILLIFIATVICLGFSLNKNEEYQEEIENISTIENLTQEDSTEGDDEENKLNENQESEVENISENIELPKQEKTIEKNITIQKTSNNGNNTQNSNIQNNNTENNNSPKVLSNSNISTSTKNDNPNVTESKSTQTTSKKIDLSKYDYYEKNPNGSYKGFIGDSSEINKLKSLIDENLKFFGYKNIKVVIDKSLSRDGTPYFTANNTNVKNAIYNCEGFSIYYYAVKEYSISTEGKESYFQTRSYIKVK